MVNILILIYVLSFLISFLFIYFDKNTITVGDLLEHFWVFLIPLINTMAVLIYIYYLIDVDKLLNKKLWGKN